MKVIIPAAGLGTRFADQHLGIPKELLPLGNMPILGHALAEAARGGFDSATVVLSPAKQQVRQFLNERGLPLPVDVVIQPEALGIGDAVLRCWQDEPIGVLLPDDVVLDSEHWEILFEVHNNDGAAALCVRTVPSETTSRFGIAECEGNRVIGLVEKPPPGTARSNLAIFGRYIVNSDVAAGLKSVRPNGELQLTYGFAAAINSPRGVRSVRFEGEIYDCGTPAEYAASVARFPA